MEFDPSTGGPLPDAAARPASLSLIEDAPETPYRAIVPFVTPALIAINVLIFLVMVVRGVSFFSPTGNQVIPWGANFGPLTESGQWWRLLSACFVHFGIVHLAMNMIILYQVGVFTELLFGNLRYLILYLIAGVGGNIAGLFFHPFSSGAGASGAIFGVYGGLFAFLLIERGVVPTEDALRIAKSAGFFLVFNLVYGLARPGTDMVAHIAGLFTGFAAGCVLAQPLTPGHRLQHGIRAAAAMVGFSALGLFAVARLPRPSATQRHWLVENATGPRVTVAHQDQLIYAGTATRADADKLAQALIQTGPFRGANVTILFDKAPGAASISIPLKGDDTLAPTYDDVTSELVDGKTVITHTTKKRPPVPWADPVFLARMRFIGPQLASAVGVLPFTIRLLNERGELKQEVRIDRTEVVTAAGDRVAYSGLATPAQATALGAALEASGYFKGLGGLVFLGKDRGGPQISFLVPDSTWDDPHTVPYLEDIGRKVEAAVGGPPLKVFLIDAARKTGRELLIR